MGRWIAPLCVLGLLACGGSDGTGEQTAAIAPPPGSARLPAADPNGTEIGDWIVTCQSSPAPGQAQPHCRLEKRDFLAIARVDAQGARIITARPATGSCNQYARFAGVDGQPVQDLLHAQKLSFLRGGEIFAREYQGPTPPCGIRIEKTGLEGFSEAYAAMMARWERVERGPSPNPPSDVTG